MAPGILDWENHYLVNNAINLRTSVTFSLRLFKPKFLFRDIALFSYYHFIFLENENYLNALRCYLQAGAAASDFFALVVPNAVWDNTVIWNSWGWFFGGCRPTHPLSMNTSTHIMALPCWLVMRKLGTGLHKIIYFLGQQSQWKILIILSLLFWTLLISSDHEEYFPEMHFMFLGIP